MILIQIDALPIAIGIGGERILDTDRLEGPGLRRRRQQRQPLAAKHVSRKRRRETSIGEFLLMSCRLQFQILPYGHEFLPVSVAV